MRKQDVRTETIEALRRRYLAVTPVMPLPGADECGNRILMKRDDLLPYALGGNKVRTALEFLADMQSEGCDAMILYGDLRSNLCRVLSLLCRERDIPAVMVATDAADECGGQPSFNEMLIRRSGVRILTCRKDAIAETVERAFALLRKEGRKPYYIFGNSLGTGRSHVPVRAYRDAWDEIDGQCRQMGESPDVIALPCGTGGTLAGLAVGRARMLHREGIKSLPGEDMTENPAGIRAPGLSRARILGFSISSRGEKRAYEAVSEAAGAGLKEAGLPGFENFPGLYELSFSSRGGGYGLYDDVILRTAEDVWRNFGIPMDPTYTAKAFQALLQYLKDHGIRGKTVLFLHTGGTPLYYDELWKEHT